MKTIDILFLPPIFVLSVYFVVRTIRSRAKGKRECANCPLASGCDNNAPPPDCRIKHEDSSIERKN